jgi:hypothetical protein
VASIAIIFRRNGKVGAFKLNMIRMSKKRYYFILFYFIFAFLKRERESEREREE